MMVASAPPGTQPRSIQSEVVEVLNAEIRPLLKIHGGGVEIIGIDDQGIVELEFSGACRGCSLQSVTYAIALRQRLLEVPGVKDVTMEGVRVSPLALQRIATAYQGHSFRLSLLAK